MIFEQAHGRKFIGEQMTIMVSIKHGLQTVDYGLRTMDYGLRTMDWV